VLHAARLADGAAPTDALLPGATPARLVRLLRDSRDELGLPVARTDVRSDENRGGRWGARLELTVHAMSRASRNAVTAAGVDPPGAVPTTAVTPGQARASARRRQRAAPPPDGPMGGPLLRAARLDAGLGEADVALAAGVPTSTVRLLEERGGEPRVTLTLGTLTRLASVLGLAPGDLWRRPDDRTAPPDRPGEAGGRGSPGDDARGLGSLLQRAGRPLVLDAVARALDWDPARTTLAVDALDCAAGATGARLVRLVALAPAPDRNAEDLLAAVGALADHGAPLIVAEAGLAFEALAHDLHDGGPLGRSRRRAHLGSLVPREPPRSTTTATTARAAPSSTPSLTDRPRRADGGAGTAAADADPATPSTRPA